MSALICPACHRPILNPVKHEIPCETCGLNHPQCQHPKGP